MLHAAGDVDRVEAVRWFILGLLRATRKRVAGAAEAEMEHVQRDATVLRAAETNAEESAEDDGFSGRKLVEVTAARVRTATEGLTPGSVWFKMQAAKELLAAGRHDDAATAYEAVVDALAVHYTLSDNHELARALMRADFVRGAGRSGDPAFLIARMLAEAMYGRIQARALYSASVGVPTCMCAAIPIHHPTCMCAAIPIHHPTCMCAASSTRADVHTHTHAAPTHPHAQALQSSSADPLVQDRLLSDLIDTYGEGRPVTGTLVPSLKDLLLQRCACLLQQEGCGALARLHACTQRYLRIGGDDNEATTRFFAGIQKQVQSRQDVEKSRTPFTVAEVQNACLAWIDDGKTAFTAAAAGAPKQCHSFESRGLDGEEPPSACDLCFSDPGSSPEWMGCANPGCCFDLCRNCYLLLPPGVWCTAPCPMEDDDAAKQVAPCPMEDDDAAEQGAQAPTILSLLRQRVSEQGGGSWPTVDSLASARGHANSVAHAPFADLIIGAPMEAALARPASKKKVAACSGAFGTVEFKQELGGYGVAVKKVHAACEEAEEPAARLQLEREIYVQAQLRHQHIVPLLGVVGWNTSSPRDLGLVMPRYSRTVFAALAADGFTSIGSERVPFSHVRNRLSWLHQLVGALEYMHRLGFAHGDVRRKTSHSPPRGVPSASLTPAGLCTVYVGTRREPDA